MKKLYPNDVYGADETGRQVKALVTESGPELQPGAYLVEGKNRLLQVAI